MRQTVNMKIKKHIPNAITCGNLFCGCLGVVSAFQGNLLWTCYLAGIAAVLDFLDGFVARLLHVKSEIGKQLDSLADMVTFGFLPGVVMYFMLQNSLTGTANKAFMMEQNAENFPAWLVYASFVITIFSALRLAKFNIDTRQTESFIGLPTPANTLLICSLPLIAHFQPNIGSYSILQHIHNPWFLLGLTLVSSYLMIAEIPLFALKFKTFLWTDNKIRYTFIILSILLLMLFQFIALPFILFLYILLSAFNN